jgi:hypothetical protein
VPLRSEVQDEAVMSLPPCCCFYRLIAANESGRSAPSGILPLLPVAPCTPSTFCFADAASQHVMRLERRPTGEWTTVDLTALQPPPGRECTPRLNARRGLGWTCEARAVGGRTGFPRQGARMQWSACLSV